MKLYRGYIETSNYDFEVTTTNKQEALNLLTEAWLKHQEDTGAWLTFDQLGISIEEVELGKVYRR